MADLGESGGGSSPYLGDLTTGEEREGGSKAISVVLNTGARISSMGCRGEIISELTDLRGSLEWATKPSGAGRG